MNIFKKILSCANRRRAAILSQKKQELLVRVVGKEHPRPDVPNDAARIYHTETGWDDGKISLGSRFLEL